MQISAISRQRVSERLVVASISDGKDSTALALALREHEIPHVRLADTGLEAPETYACLGIGESEGTELAADTQRPPRWIGHDHLEALGITGDQIRGWLTSGMLASPRGDGFYLRGTGFDQVLEPLVARQTIGRGHLLALGVSSTVIAKWLRWGTLHRTSHAGFYAITRAAFEALRPAPTSVVRSAAIETVKATASPAPTPSAEPLALTAPAPDAAPRLRIVASTITRARAFVAQHHRHLAPPVSGLFAVGLARGDDLVGVAIVGRPVARGLQVAGTAEITRICTLGDRNACSMLLAACRRGSSALGYSRLITYTLASEPGTSLRAAGWVEVAKVKGRAWHCESRPRTARDSPDKRRWEPRSSRRDPAPPLVKLPDQIRI